MNDFYCFVAGCWFLKPFIYCRSWMSCLPTVTFRGLILLFAFNTSETLSMEYFVVPFTKYFSTFLENNCSLNADAKALISEGMLSSSILSIQGPYLSLIVWRKKIHLSQIFSIMGWVGNIILFYMDICIRYYIKQVISRGRGLMLKCFEILFWKIEFIRHVSWWTES